MSETSFKNYVVNYDLVVQTSTGGFEQLSQMAQRMQKPLKDLASHIGRIQKSANGLSKKDSFKITPTIDMSSFDKQAQSLITRAEKVASQVNAILNGAFTVNPAAAKNQGGKSGTKGGGVTEKKTLTTAQLKKEAERVEKRIRDLYGPRGTRGETTKSFKSLTESLKNDAAALETLKKLRTQLAAVKADIKAAGKSGGKITKNITDGVATGIIQGTKKGGKKLIQQPQVTEAFNGVLQSLTAGKAVQIPVSVVANAQTAESVNAAMAKLRGQIKPIVIPITVATNIDAAKAVRETVQGLQNVITPSATGTKPVSGGKGKGKGSGTTTPVVKTNEQKALEKELRGLQSEQNKYNFWKQRHDEWKDKVAAIQKGNATATPSDAVLQKALEKVLYTDKGKKRLTPVSKPKLMSLSAAETAELNALTLATDPLIKQKAELESRLAALQKSAARKALTGKKFEEAKNIKQTLLPQINKQLEAAGEARRAELLQKQAGYARQYEIDKKAYQQWLGKQEEYHKQLDREAKALKKPSIQKKVNEAARAMMAVPTTKLPAEPKLAEGIRTSEQIEARRAEINQRLAAISGTAAQTTGKKVGASGGRTTGTARGLGLSIPIAQNLQQLQNLTTGRPISFNTRVVSNGQAGFDLNQHIARLQNIALTHPIRLDTRVIPTGQAGFELNMHIQRLQELALAHPIRLNTTIAQNAAGVKGAKGTTPLNTVPLEGMVENVVVSKAVKVSGGPVKIEGLVENVKMGKGGKPIEVKANLVAPAAHQLNNLRELSNIWKVLPKTGSRTYTVNLKMPGIENIGKLKELAGMVGTMPPSQRRVYNQGQSQAGGRGTGSNMYIGRGPNTATRYAGRPRGTMNTFAYQLMGNTSLGARTPVFLDMMKGMGMMSGVGAAMSTLTNAFSNASEYQNTMVTAKSILEANYQGSNFQADFGNMERIVRDVAKKTKFTAPQAADAARFMAMAGLNIPMINASIRPIADVAVIGDNDLGEVADKITNIQTAFGIQPNRMRALADALTKTFTSSNTDMMMLAESMEYAAPMAHLAGAQVEDALAMIGIMGNAGIQGSMAGTTLRMMYQNVINPNKKQQKMWNDLGISLKDAQGNPRQLMDILGDLRKKVRISSEDKNLDGTWKDEGTPIAEAVSRLFRVTASAGAGTLLENLDKVIALAEANRNADGLSQRISEVKQNDVKGMWAKMTSAFTDAVVTEFESNESPIKGYLENLIKYFNSPDFKDMLHDIFDLVTSMMDTLGTFAKIWKSIYDTCGGLIKYILIAQFWMTQIGYLFAPLRSVWMTISRGYGAAKGLMMGTAAMGAVGGAGAMSSTATAGGAAMMGGGSGAKFTNKAIVEAQKRAARFDQASFISRGNYANVAAAHTANAARLEAQIAKKQMQWFAMSNMTGTERALRANDNRSGRWNLAYTNPQAASELPTRHKMMMAREREVAALQRELANGQAGLNQARAQMEADAERSRAAHRGTNMLIAAQRHKTRMPNTAALQRLQRMGKISGWGAKVARDGMLLRGAGSAFAGALGMSGFLGGLATAGKALLSFATGPIGLTATALIGIPLLINGIVKSRREAEEARRKELERLGESFRTIFTISDYVKEKRNEIANRYSDSSLFNVPLINISAGTVNLTDKNEDVQGLKGIASDENYSQFVVDLTKKADNISVQEWANTFRNQMDLLASNPELFLETAYSSSHLKDLTQRQDELQKQYWGASRLYFEQLSSDPDKRQKETRDYEQNYLRLGNEFKQANNALNDYVYISGIQGAIAKRAMEMPEYLSALDEIGKISSEYISLPKQQQVSKQQEYYNKINEYIESFNPAGRQDLLKVVDRASAEQALNTPADKLYGSYYQIYNWLKDYRESLPYYNRMVGTMLSNKGAYTKEDDRYYENLMRILGNVPFKLSSASQPMTMPLNKFGEFDMNALSEKMAQENIPNVQAALYEIFKGYYNVLKTQDAYKDLFDMTISEEEFVSNLWFASLYKQRPALPTMVNGQQVTPPAQYDYRFGGMNGVFGANAFNPQKQEINLHLHGNMFNVETMNAEDFTSDKAKEKIMNVLYEAIRQLNQQ